MCVKVYDLFKRPNHFLRPKWTVWKVNSKNCGSEDLSLRIFICNLLRLGRNFATDEESLETRALESSCRPAVRGYPEFVFKKRNAGRKQPLYSDWGDSGSSGWGDKEFFFFEAAKENPDHLLMAQISDDDPLMMIKMIPMKRRLWGSERWGGWFFFFAITLQDFVHRGC